jgi:dihydroorotate dehydrogenase electron transfer subunit
MKQITAPITSDIEVMPNTHLAWLDCPPIATAAKPGQFVMMNCGEDCYLPRPLSIHRTDGEKIALLFNIVGKGTDWLAQRQTGDYLSIFGPLGSGYAINPGSKNLLLVAGGMGIAPLVFLADAAVTQGKKATILLGAASAEHLLPVSLPTNTGEAPICSINVVNATEDGSEGFKGTVTDLLPIYLDAGDQIFACGPVGMYRTMAQMPELKNKPVQISLEVIMGCGAGVCYGCTIRTKNGLKQVCKDGPVFDLEDIIWEEFNRL